MQTSESKPRLQTRNKSEMGVGLALQHMRMITSAMILHASLNDRGRKGRVVPLFIFKHQ